MLQNYLYCGEKNLGGCSGIINQRKIRYMTGKDKTQKYEILRLDYWYNGDIEIAYSKVKISKKFLKWFIDDMTPDYFNKTNQTRLLEIQNELLESNYKGISDSKNWVGEYNTKIGFWLWNGYSEEEAKIKVKQVQSKNGLKKVEKSKNNPELYHSTRPQRTEYWVKSGLTYEEAIIKVKEIQSTNSIKRMGERKFNERKEKFKVSINSEKTKILRRKIMEEKGLWIPLELKTTWELYKNKVWYITNKQDIENLKNYNKRGRAGIKGSYNLYHKISIKYGFDNNISEKIIGQLDNLQMLSWEENYSKGINCYSKIKD